PAVPLALSLAGWGAVALASLGVALGRGGSMVGRSRGALVALAFLAPAVLVALAVALTLAFRDAAPAPPAAIDLRCFLVTVLFALAPFVGFLLLRRGSDPVHPRASAAALGVAAGAWGSLFIELHCPVWQTFHIVAAHTVPVALFGALGALVGER